MQQIKHDQCDAIQNQQLFNCCIKTIQGGFKGYYKAIKIVQFSLNNSKKEINAGQIGLMIQSLHSVKCLHLGILSSNDTIRNEITNLNNELCTLGLKIIKNVDQEEKKEEKTKDDQFVKKIEQQQVSWSSSDSESSSSTQIEQNNENVQKYESAQNIEMPNVKTTDQKDQWSESSDSTQKKVHVVQQKTTKRKIIVKQISQQEKQKQSNESSSSDSSW